MRPPAKAMTGKAAKTNSKIFFMQKIIKKTRPQGNSKSHYPMRGKACTIYAECKKSKNRLDRQQIFIQNSIICTG